MTLRLGVTRRNSAFQRDRDTRKQLFYLFLIAQICAIFCMVVGILFFILRFLRFI
ncbi:MAG: hypothetical protein JSV55_07195 [Deltaproteobacteria bacterium]|nr:MAG: hypothetical protein JSV40_08375 [Deltaproteobacteria bacterium]UCH08739.1 MAG: hypothetical protein JSV55_07195 [Deltaproteobacteria bacterium]